MTDETKKSGCLARTFKGLDLFRKIVLNVVFFFLFFLFLALLFAGEELPEVPDRGALLVAPDGMVVEEYTTDPVERALAEALDEPIREVLLRDVLDGLELAAGDDRIQAVVLDLKSLGGIGPSKLLEIEAALGKVREAGKTVVATADFYGQHAYYLAAQADQVFLHEMGITALQGYGAYQAYFKEGLDRLGVDVNVFRVGEYKSAVEPFLRNDMSPEAEEANLAWLSDLWDVYVDGAATGRGLEPAAVRDYVQNVQPGLAERQGDTAQYALDSGLVDHIGSRQDFEQLMLDLLDEEDSEIYPHISLDDYLLVERPPAILASQSQVAVLVAQGPIVDGSGDEATVGGESFSEKIRQTRQDDTVKAIVLRVDSPGGSAFASELIRQELAAARAEGLPVVVSMSSVAASGGYWISTASDAIYALPNTITGSIGIFGVFPTFEDPMQKYLGTNVDGVGTTDWTDAYRPDMEMEDDAAAVLQMIIEKSYRDFLERVAEARNMTVEEVDRIARGRVWSGRDAHERGLVDELGGLDAAVARAAEMAGLEKDYDVVYPQPELDFFDQLLVDMSARMLARVAPQRLSRSAVPGPVQTLYDWMARESRRLALFTDPRGAYAYCFCEVQ